METPDFHFTLGPVQGFVAHARRTRDFWAGSFLLSWLAGVAMRATEAQGGTIVFPEPPRMGNSEKRGDEAPNYLDWIADPANKTNPVSMEQRTEIYPHPQAGPVQGAIPNRFKATVPVGFDGRIVEKAVRDAWLALAKCIWEHDIAPRLSSAQTESARKVWNQQHKAFWEIAWVVSADPKALDRRKNWRSHLPPEEPGMKCHLMEGWQELSGIPGMSKDDNEARRLFWNALTKNRETDFRQAERLCAIAFVKRCFARHFDAFGKTLELGASGARLHLRGWRLPVNRPSVVYMAAVHWLEELLNRAGAAQADELQALFDAGQRLHDEGDEWESRIPCLVKAAGNRYASLISLDGALFFEHLRLGLLKEFRDTLKDRPEAEQARKFARKCTAVEEFGTRLQTLADALGKDMPGQPTPFYAVLMMDGDNLGAHMGKLENQTAIPKALDAFTTETAEIVPQSNGTLIYAGGDDVLALLPLEDALGCALRLRNAYLKAFADHLPQGCLQAIPTTLSGAVIFAHVKTPLGEVLRQAHRVLDKIAKDRTGRDALAVRVLKPGGEHLTWAQPWECALVDGRLRLDGSGPDIAPTSVWPGGLVKTFLDAAQGSAGFSGKFFFQARERLRLLDGEGIDEKLCLKFTKKERIALLRGDFLAAEPPLDAYPEHLRGKDQQNERRDWLNKLIQSLLDHCTVWVRHYDRETETVNFTNEPQLSTDALMLVRFLAHKGVEPRG